MLLVILKAVVEEAWGGGWEGSSNNKHLTTQKGEDCRWEVLPEVRAGADQVKTSLSQQRQMCKGSEGASRLSAGQRIGWRDKHCLATECEF